MDYNRGHEELSPNMTAHLLLKGSSKVAITTRFANHSLSLAYVDALRSQGVETRMVINNSDNHSRNHSSGIQDFCFLKHANRLVGQGLSTFSFWAGYLGNSNETIMYAVKGEAATAPHLQWFSYNWTNPKLRNRFQYEIYDSDR